MKSLIRDFESAELPEDRPEVGTITYPNKTIGVSEGAESKEFASYTGPVIKGDVKEEVEMWTKLLDVLQRGPSKPNSPIFELNKINKEIDKAARAKKPTDSLEALKATIEGCCPSGSTVQDSLIYKSERAGILKRILQITGIGEYITDDRRY